MLQFVLWASLVLTGGVAGWMASAWVHQRRIEALMVQLRVARQTLTAHSDQARRQIGQLQTELAQRPPAPAPETAVEAVRGQLAPLVENIRRRSTTPDRFLIMDDGFPQTAVVGGEAFAPTQLIR
jgi:hypothetical protein